MTGVRKKSLAIRLLSPAWWQYQVFRLMSERMRKSGNAPTPKDLEKLENINIDVVLLAVDKYIDEWGLPSRALRREKRLNSSMEDMVEFYMGMGMFLDRIISFLNQFPLDKIPPEHQKLANATLALLELDAPLCKWNRQTLEDAISPRRMIPKTSVYDRNARGEVSEMWNDALRYSGDFRI